MAKKHLIIRKYNFPDSHLMRLCNTITTFMIRDILQFADYGLDTSTANDYTNEINSFENFPTDIELRGKQGFCTEQKFLSDDNLKTIIRNVMARVVTVFPEGTAKFDAFGTKGMSAMADAELLKCGRRVARRATEYLAQLSGTGLTAAIIADLLAKCQAFEDAIAAQEDAIDNREIFAEERTDLGNKIYDKLMNYSSFGQTIWYDKSEAHYNDYIIYTKSGNLVKPIEMKIESGETQNIIQKLFPADAVFKITITGKAKLKLGFCADAKAPVEAGVEFAAGETKTVTAAELCNNAANNFLNCTNADALQGSLKIKLPKE